MVQPGWKLMYPLCCCSCCTSTPGTENGVDVTSPLHSQSSDPSLTSACFTDSWAAASRLPSGVPLGRPTDLKHLWLGRQTTETDCSSHTLWGTQACAQIAAISTRIHDCVGCSNWAATVSRLPERDSSVALFFQEFLFLSQGYRVSLFFPSPSSNGFSAVPQSGGVCCISFGSFRLFSLVLGVEGSRLDSCPLLSGCRPSTSAPWGVLSHPLTLIQCFQGASGEVCEELLSGCAFPLCSIFSLVHTQRLAVH